MSSDPVRRNYSVGKKMDAKKIGIATCVGLIASLESDYIFYQRTSVGCIKLNRSRLTLRRDFFMTNVNNNCFHLPRQFVDKETSLRYTWCKGNKFGGDILCNTLMNLFVKYMEKQEILSKLTENEKLHGYNYSEIHTIAAIGDLEKPNVTEIANYMNVTRGAISKITKKLLEQKLIEAYQIKSNRQKIFFRLTETGQLLYDEHEKRHNLWLKRDTAFMNQFDSEILKQVEDFMQSFNDYLESQIEELGGNADEN